jgi:hypothetical protein
MGGGARFASIGAAPRFAGAGWAGARWAGAGWARPGFSPRFAHAAFPRGRFFHHRFRRFAFVGPFAFADYSYYDSCWQTIWTAWGPQWTNVCVNYGFY